MGVQLVVMMMLVMLLLLRFVRVEWQGNLVVSLVVALVL